MLGFVIFWVSEVFDQNCDRVCNNKKSCHICIMGTKYILVKYETFGSLSTWGMCISALCFWLLDPSIWHPTPPAQTAPQNGHWAVQPILCSSKALRGFRTNHSTILIMLSGWNVTFLYKYSGDSNSQTSSVFISWGFVRYLNGLLFRFPVPC